MRHWLNELVYCRKDLVRKCSSTNSGSFSRQRHHSNFSSKKRRPGLRFISMWARAIICGSLVIRCHRAPALFLCKARDSRKAAYAENFTLGKRRGQIRSKILATRVFEQFDKWWSRPDLNWHARFTEAADFKSAESTDFSTRPYENEILIVEGCDALVHP